MSSKYHSLETVEINPKRGNPNMSVILLHGLGGSARDLSPIANFWRLKPDIRPRWVLPQAPQRPVTINNGQVMPAWYDILSIDVEHRVEPTSVQNILIQLTGLISHEIAMGIPPERILLAGFSQGGAVAIETMLCYPKPLAGVVCLSGYLLNRSIIEAGKIQPHVKQTPIFYCHGEQDTVVPFPFALISKEVLEKQGFKITWRSYPKLGHFVNNREILEIKKWVDETIFTKQF